MTNTICYGIVHVAEAVIAWLYFEYLFSRKVPADKLRIGFSYVAGYSVLFAAFMANVFILNAVAFIAVNYLIVRNNYYCAPKTAIEHSAFLTFGMTVSEIVAGVILMPLSRDFSAYLYSVPILISMTVISKLLYLLIALAACRLFSPHKREGKEPGMMLLFCGLPIVSVTAATVMSYLCASLDLGDSTGILIILNVLSLLVVNLIFFVIYNHLQKVSADRLALQLRVLKEKADTAYYEALQSQAANQRILIHDIKNHLQVIDALAKQDKPAEISGYVSEIVTSLGTIQQARLCDHPILNMVLLHSAEACRKLDIAFNCDVQNDCAAFMDATGVTSLYGNLLTNAIEAAAASAARQIAVSVTRCMDSPAVVITVVNSCDNAPLPDGAGHFLTHKGDQGLHGIGLQSIAEVTRKYNGISTMYYDAGEKQFHYVLRFPIPDKVHP